MGFVQTINLFFLFSICLSSVFSFQVWRKYEEPIKIAEPNKNGIYEFDLLLEPHMTMTRSVAHKKKEILDYDPDAKAFVERDKDQNDPHKCNTTTVISRLSDSEKIMNNILEDVLQYHGLHRRITTINGNSPGEVIVVPYGAEVFIRVRNHLMGESMTLHIHGVDKKGLWYTDGAAFIQQCPIAPGSIYTYRFIADTPGSHWYHGHLMTDRADGLAGGFVVKMPNETFPDGNGNRVVAEREYYYLLQDLGNATAYEQWLNLRDRTMKWVAGYDFEQKDRCWYPHRTYDGSTIGGSHPLSAILVGNKGWHAQNDIKTRPSSLPLTTFKIKREEYQVHRIVHGGVSFSLVVWLEDHEILVIAVDGVEIKPIKVDAINLLAGERYDILIRGLKNPKQKTYRFMFENLAEINWQEEQLEHFFGLANLEYEDVFAPETDEVDFKHTRCTQKNKCVILNCPFGEFAPYYNYTCLSAAKIESAKEIEDVELISQQKFEKGYKEYFLNMHHDSHLDGWMYEHPNGMPYYHHGQMHTISKECDPTKCERHHTSKYDHNCDCFVNFNFSIGDIVQMTIFNMGKGGTIHAGYAHTFHIHGTHFYVMKIGYPSYNGSGLIEKMNPDIPCDDKVACLDVKWRNEEWLDGNLEGMEKNPSYRDTISIPTGGYTTIRFRANNPGWWFAHCHIMLHNMHGMAFAFRVGEHDEVPVPPDNFPHSCGVFNQPELPAHLKSSANTYVAPLLLLLFVATILS